MWMDDRIGLAKTQRRESLMIEDELEVNEN